MNTLRKKNAELYIEIYEKRMLLEDNAIEMHKVKKDMNEIEYTQFDWLNLWLENWIPFALFSPSHPTCTTRNCGTLKKKYQAYIYIQWNGLCVHFAAISTPYC